MAVPIADSEFEDLIDLSEVNENIMKELKEFLEQFKDMKVEDVFDSEHAKKAIRRSIELYQKEFS